MHDYVGKGTNQTKHEGMGQHCTQMVLLRRGDGKAITSPLQEHAANSSGLLLKNAMCSASAWRKASSRSSKSCRKHHHSWMPGIPYEKCQTETTHISEIPKYLI